MVGEVVLSSLDTAQPMRSKLFRVMEHPKAKGDRSTLAIMLALSEAGYEPEPPDDCPRLPRPD